MAGSIEPAIYIEMWFSHTILPYEYMVSVGCTRDQGRRTDRYAARPEIASVTCIKAFVLKRSIDIYLKITMS